MKTDQLKGLRKRLTTQAPVEALVLLLILFSQNAGASPASSWSKRPNWTASANTSHKDEASTSVRSSIQVDDTPAISVSPFSPGSHNLAIDLGQVFLMGDLTKYNNSIGSQLHYTYGVSDLFAFDSSLGYSEHTDGKFALGSLLTGMRMNLSWYDKVIPYATAGLGFYRPSYRDLTADANSSVNAVLFGIHLGPGVDLELSKNFFFGASLIYHTTFGTTQILSNGSTASLGGSYTSFFLHTGVTF
jgi:hypothetical protein